MDLKTILEQNDHSIDTSLLGYDFNISADRNVYNAIRNKYKKLALAAKEKYAKMDSELTDINDLLNNAPNAFTVAIEDALIELLQDIISVDIFTLDKDSIIELAFDGVYFDEFADAYNAIDGRANRILAELDNDMAARELRKNSRPRWQSATFGGNAINAWSNQLDAAGMNLAEGAAHSIVNGIANSISKSNAESQLKKLFNSNSLRSNLIDSVYDSCFNLHLLLIDIVRRHSSINIKGKVSDDDEKKAQAMFNNFTSLNLDEEKTAKFINDIFQLNPYNRDFYKVLIKKFGDENYELGSFAESFGMNTAEIKDEILVEFVEENLGETEADAYACRTKTQEKATEIGFNISEGSLADEIIAERLEELDLLYRTVDEIVFETRDEADLAKKELIEIQEIMNDIQSPTKESTLSYENELLEKREKIDAFQTSIKNKYLEKIDNYLSDFDKKFRKEGFLSTGMTREQAGNERALQFAKTLSVNTYEELDNAKVTLVANLPEYGITAEQATLAFQYFADCENKLNTVDGVVFHSRESAELGRKEYAEISKIITDIQSPSRESTLSYEKDLLAKREKIDAFQTSVKNRYLEKIDKYLSDFDKKFRKEGLLSTGMTREQAGNERALQFAKTLSVKTYEELDNAKIILVENLPEYGITEEQATLAFEYFADCEDKLNTVDGVVFHSREDAESGRKEYSEIAKIMSSVTPPTKDSLLSYEKNLFAVLGQIEQFETDVKLKYIKIINDYLEKFDNLFKQTGLFSKAETREAAAQDKALKFVESIATFSCTYADIDRARAELNALLPEIGIDISQAFKATAHLQDREDRLNTVDGIVFSTRDETALAKKEFIEIQKIMSNVTPPTSDSLLDYEQELFVVKSELEKFTTTVKNKYLDLIQKHLASFDEKFRRVSLLKVAETREEAAKERALKFVKSQTYNTVDDVEKARSGLLALLSRLGITAEQADEAMNYITKAENRINGVETPSKFGGFMSRFKK